MSFLSRSSCKEQIMNKTKGVFYGIRFSYTGSDLVTAGSSPGKKKRKADPPVISCTKGLITETNVSGRASYSRHRAKPPVFIFRGEFLLQRAAPVPLSPKRSILFYPPLPLWVWRRYFAIYECYHTLMFDTDTRSLIGLQHYTPLVLGISPGSGGSSNSAIVSAQ